MNTTNISVPIKGMNTDAHPLNLSEQGYDYALNAVVEDFNGNGFPLIQNEASNIPCAQFTAGFKVIGYANIVEQHRILLFLVNPITGGSQIGEINGSSYSDSVGDTTSSCYDCGEEYVPITASSTSSICTYNTIATNTCLKFSIDHPIKVIYRIEGCGIQIFFTDNSNPPRYLEFDYLDGDSSKKLVIRDKFKTVIGFDPDNCDVPVYADSLDCNKLLLNPTLDYPCITLVDVTQGGDLKAGVYQFVLAYANENGLKRSTYFPATNPIPIFERTQTFETDYNTGKAIQLEIEGISANSPYLYFNIAVIRTINNVTSFELVGTFATSTHTITYTGFEKSLIDLTENDIFESKVFYSKASYSTSSNDFLFFAGLEETPKFNVQRISNNIKLGWQTVAIPEAVYRDARFVNKFRSYLRDEVYAFGLVLLLANGEETVVGHIPGPSKAYFQTNYALNVDAVVANADVISDPSCGNVGRNKTWQVYNTAKVVYTNPSVPITDSCDDNKCYQYGDFAYWESIDTYPNKPEIYGNLCGLPIRHHKFPDSYITHTHDGLGGSKGFTQGNVVFPIGVRVDHASVLSAIQTAINDNVITADQAATIKGYRIVRGNRASNKSIIAKGLIYDVNNYVKDDNTYYFANYPYNDLRSDPFLTNTLSNYDDHDDPEGPDLPFTKTSRYTFHSPDTHFRQPNLGDELKLETLEYGKSEGYFNHSEDQAKQRLLSTVAYLMAFSGGLVAMFLATNEVRESKYTIRGVDASALGLAAGAYGPTIVPPLGPQAIFYDNITGAPIIALPPMSTIERVTKLGTKEQMHSIYAPVAGTVMDPVLGTAIGIFSAANSFAYKLALALSETQILVNLFKALIPKKNYGIQYNSIGKYNNYQTVNNTGNKRRKIETYSYIKPEMAMIEEQVTSLGSGLTNIRFNNWQRESSVYLKIPTDAGFAVPTVTDNSRFNINDRGSSGSDFKHYDGKRFYKDVSSFYGSIKQFVPNQYGTINNIEYIDTGNCIFFKNGEYLDCELSIFGGDTFISRFALKRKHSYFLQTRFGHMDETDVKYSDLANVAYPRFYYDSVTGVGSDIGDSGNFIDVIKDIITDPATALGRPKSYLDSKTDKMFWQNGKIYLYNYGIPYFLVETDINVDMRYGENSKEKDFFPRQQDLDFWLQEKNVPPYEDNTYFYNFTYSKQNKEHAYGKYAPDYDPSKNCVTSHPNRIIYSNGSNWLNYKANDFYDFPLSAGRVIGVDGIENDKVLVRSENTTQVFNAYVTLATSADTIQVGTGGMFQSKPQEYAHTTLGYAGTQHSAILHTEFGHIWADAKRGQVFNLSPKGLDEISNIGKKNWFKQNLPFQLLKDFPSLSLGELDNAFKGTGLIMAFDKRFNRLILTKLDYKKISSDVTYSNGQFLVNNVPVSLDSKYFCNKSWTISYNFITQSWTSYHSYMPNYYIERIDYFLSGNSTGLWAHSLTNKSFQTFYGKLEPFTIQTISKADISKNHLNSIEFGLDVIRYHNDYDSFLINNITFNKAVISNNNQSSGNLILEYNDKQNLSKLSEYPKTNLDSTTIRVSNSDGIWRINQFYDLAVSRANNIPLWLNNYANTAQIVNNRAINYNTPDLDKKRIRGEYNKVLLSNDKESSYKFIFKFLVNNSVKTFR